MMELKQTCSRCHRPGGPPTVICKGVPPTSLLHGMDRRFGRHRSMEHLIGYHLMIPVLNTSIIPSVAAVGEQQLVLAVQATRA